MNNGSEQILTGGLMNLPTLKNNLIYKEVNPASDTIHRLLNHIRSKGVEWVPESLGVNSEGKHVFTYLEGIVPHNSPEWLWDDSILVEIAARLRLFHDATVDFDCRNSVWALENDEEKEVICHNDFAPYNCVFVNRKFTGLIDFDLCSPGTRLWDIAHTAYRFVPLLPTGNVKIYKEISPFLKEAVMARLTKFLEAYGNKDLQFLYDKKQVIGKVEKRLRAIANWSKAYGMQTQNRDVMEHAEMYMLHAKWLGEHFFD
jgi:hypothetical protein